MLLKLLMMPKMLWIKLTKPFRTKDKTYKMPSKKSMMTKFNSLLNRLMPLKAPELMNRKNN